MKKTLIVLFAVLVVLMVSSCATILSDDSSSILVNTEPVGALIKVDGIPSGTTPARLLLDNDSSHTIEVSMEGYETQTFNVKKSIKWGWQVVDLLLAPGVGNVVDFITSKGYSLRPNKINVVLVKSN